MVVLAFHLAPIDPTPYIVIPAFTLIGSLAFMIVLILLYGD